MTKILNLRKLTNRKYPYYYETDHNLIDHKIVESAVEEIIKIVKTRTGKNSKDLSVLDVGSGRGEYAIEMTRKFKKVIGIEPCKDVFDCSKKIVPKEIKNIKFYNVGIENFNSKEKFDVVVMLTIFEHLSDHKKSFNRIFNLLKENGIIYLTAPNKYWIFEQHYGLPFLSWLPLKISNKYLKYFRGVESFEDCSYSKGYQGMKKFFDKYPCRYEFTLPFNPNAAYIGCGKKGYYSFVKKFGINLIQKNSFFWNLSKGFIMVIKKLKD